MIITIDDPKQGRLCPKCNKAFVEHPAISREDNKTEICPTCGMKEAMDAYHAVAKSRD